MKIISKRVIRSKLVASLKESGEKSTKGPWVNETVGKIHEFITTKIVDIPDLTPGQKKAIRQYSLDMAAVVIAALVKGMKESRS